MSEKQPRPKDYDKLVTNIIEEASRARLDIRVLETIVYGTENTKEGFPFVMLSSKNREAKYNCVITAGFHGNEWWSVDCLLRALTDLDTRLWNLWIFPVANPFGWKYNLRMNGEKKESNFRVGQRDTKELSLIFKHLPNRIDLFIDVHGDADRHEVYAYERRLPHLDSLAKLTLKDVANYFDLYKSRTVYREPNRGGVVTSGKEATCEEYLFEHHGATYSITLEIPGKVLGTGTNRVAGGARMIVSALNNFEQAKGIGVKPKEEVKPQIVEQSIEQTKENV